MAQSPIGLSAGEITPEQQELANQGIKERFHKQAEQRRELLKAGQHQAILQLPDKFNRR